MTLWGWIRVFALVFTFAFARITFFNETAPEHQIYRFLIFINAFLYSHFIMAYWASRKQALQIAFTRNIWFPLMMLAVSWVLITELPAEVSFLWFGVHFAFSDAYSPMLGGYSASTSPEQKSFRTAHVLYLLAIYYLATAHTINYSLNTGIEVWRVVRGVVYVTTVAATMNYGYRFYRRWKTDTDRDWAKDFGLPELMLLPMAILSHHYMTHWTLVTLYHITFWFLFVLLQEKNRSLVRFAEYVVPTVAIMAFVAYTFPPFAIGESHGAPPVLAFKGYTYSLFSAGVVEASLKSMRWGTFHIFLSLALSPLNPGWIRQLQSRL